jgi:hypothetical protein
MGLMSVRYVIAPKDFPINLPQLRPVCDNAVRAYENRQWLPRTYLVDSIIRVDEETEAWNEIVAASFSPRREAVVEDCDWRPPSERPASEGPGTAEIVLDRRDRVEIDVRAARDAFLILSDSYYPGWTASLDGARVEIYRANYLFRGLRMPAGTHRVAFQYVDWPFRIGAVITLLTLVAVIALLHYGDTAGRRERAASASEAAAREGVA